MSQGSWQKFLRKISSNSSFLREFISSRRHGFRRSVMRAQGFRKTFEGFAKNTSLIMQGLRKVFENVKLLRTPFRLMWSSCAKFPKLSSSCAQNTVPETSGPRLRICRENHFFAFVHVRIVLKAFFMKSCEEFPRMFDCCAQTRVAQTRTNADFRSDWQFMRKVSDHVQFMRTKTDFLRNHGRG